MAIFSKPAKGPVILAASTNQEVLHLIAAADPDQDLHLAAWIADALRQHESPVPPSVDSTNIIRAFTTAISQYEPIPESLTSALATRHQVKADKYEAQRSFLRGMGITGKWQETCHLAYDDIPKYELPKLPTSYPPLGTWAVETLEIRKLWDTWVRTGNLGDIRAKRHPLHFVKSDRLKLVIPATQSCIVTDPTPPKSSKSKSTANPDSSATPDIVLIVLRDFCNETTDAGVLDWLAEIIGEAVSTRKTARKEDPGSIVQAGFSAGSRSATSFGWVRNLEREFTEAERFKTDHAHAYAFFWNLLKHRLPPAILDDFSDFFKRTMLPVMSPSWQNITNRKGTYSIKTKSATHTFHNAELAPPSGVMAQNYSRAMHSEGSPHKWAAAFTVVRNGGTRDGGHFYLGDYGIKVESAANTVVIWQPKHRHGTSLQNRVPGNETPEFLQQGMAFVTPSRLPGAFQKYVEGQGDGEVESAAGLKEARDGLFGSEGDEDFGKPRKTNKIRRSSPRLASHKVCKVPANSEGPVKRKYSVSSRSSAKSKSSIGTRSSAKSCLM